MLALLSYDLCPGCECDVCVCPDDTLFPQEAAARPADVLPFDLWADEAPINPHSDLPDGHQAYYPAYTAASKGWCLTVGA